MARQTKARQERLPLDRPDLAFERTAGGVVCGVDEAGRGPLAGPVVVAAVVLHEDAPISGLNDSKKLTARKREALFEEIQAKADVSVVYVSAERIDRLNIRGATLWGMREAVRGLPLAVEMALVDGRDIPPGLPCAGSAIISGDALSQSIAAASIIAKVSRDRLMQEIHALCPEYGFARHMGYGVPEHLDAIRRIGPSPWHRRSFAPVREAFAVRAMGQE
jgi:ribonuclease HII